MRRPWLSDLLHVLAQLPPAASLELAAGNQELAMLRPLSSAYGLDARISLREVSGEQTAWRFGGTSPEAGPLSAGNGRAEPEVTMGEMVESLWPPDGEVTAAADPVGDVMAGQRIAVVTNLPTHYRLPLFATLAVKLAAVDASLRVFFLGAEAAGRPWLESGTAPAFEHEFLESWAVPVRRRRTPFLPRNLRGRLAAFDPTIVLAAGFSPFSTVEAALYARRRRIPFGIWSGETPALAARASGGALRRAERRWLTRRASFAIAYGSLAARYLRTLRPDLPVVIGRNTSVAAASMKARGEDGSPVELLAVADTAVPGKGIEVLIAALAQARDLDCRLTVIGGGPVGGGAKAGGDSRIRFLGPLPHEDVLAAYRGSDAFLFPSRVDPFGLAIVEAMAAGLPVVVSRAAGAAADLAVEGTNALVAEAGSAPSWAGRITTLVEDDELRKALGTGASRTIRRRWTLDHAAEAMTAGMRLGALVARGGTLES
jgi:glycosyltransferase involved in cell wall biosynthesis